MMCGSTKPKEVVVGGGGDSGTGPKCPRCGKTVYDAERAIGVNTVNVPFRFCPSACLTVYLSGGLSICPRCSKTVYDAERAIGVNAVNVLFCFRLSVCWPVCLSVSMRQDSP